MSDVKTRAFARRRRAGALAAAGAGAVMASAAPAQAVTVWSGIVNLEVTAPDAGDVSGLETTGAILLGQNRLSVDMDGDGRSDFELFIATLFGDKDNVFNVAMLSGGGSKGYSDLIDRPDLPGPILLERCDELAPAPLGPSDKCDRTDLFGNGDEVVLGEPDVRTRRIVDLNNNISPNTSNIIKNYGIQIPRSDGTSLAGWIRFSEITPTRVVVREFGYESDPSLPAVFGAQAPLNVVPIPGSWMFSLAGFAMLTAIGRRLKT